MPINGKVKSIYDTLKGGGADVGTEQEFNDWFFAKGAQGYKNRKSVYDTLKGGGADAGASYEEFAGWLGLHAVKGGGNVVNKTKAASQSRTNGAASTPQQRAQGGQTDALGAMGAVAKWGQQLARDTKQAMKDGQAPLTAEDKARMSAEMGGMMADVERSMNIGKQIREQNLEKVRNPWKVKGPQLGFGTPVINHKGEVQYLRDLTGGEDVKAGIHAVKDPDTGNTIFVTENGEEYGAGEYQLAKLRQQELDRAKDEGALMRHQVETLSDDVEEKLQEAKDRSMEALVNDLESADFYERGIGAYAPGMNYNPKYSMQARVDYNPEVVNLETAQSSLKRARQLIREADINARKGTLGAWAKRSFVGGLVRGFGDKFFDVSTWDFGGTDIKEGSALLTALNKADKKEPLTESEQALLDAKCVELAVTAQLATQIGRGYKAGQVTGEMAPFMLEMAINPAAKAGEAAVNKLVRYCLKRFPQKMMQKGWKGAVGRGLVSGTARVAGDIAGSAIMTATTGLGQVKAGQIQNQIGDIKYEMDQHGNVHYSDRENEMTPEDAWKKSFKEQWKERGSEMIGGYFAPIIGTMGKITAKMLTSRAGQKVGGKALMDWINSMSANKLVTGMRGFLERTQWHGVGGEYFEEKAGDVLDALFIGNVNFNLRGEDGKLFTAENSFWNLDDNIDTLLGVSVFGGLMSAINSAGFSYDVYRARKSMRLSGAAGRTAFGSERGKDWESFDARLQSDDLDAVKEMLQEMLTSDDYTDAQRNAIVTHAKNVMSYRGYVMGEAKKEEAGVWDTDKEADQQMWDDGYKLQDAEEIYNSRAARDAAADDFAMYFGEEAAARFAEDPGASLTQILEDENISDGAKNVARIYNSAAQRYNGVLARINDEIDERVTESDVSVDNVTDAGGNVRRATLTETDEAGEPKQVYIVSGDVVMRETGDGRRVVDQEASDKSIFVKDTPDGKPRQVDISEIASAEEPVAADEAKAEAAQQIEAEVANREGDKLDFGMSFEDGQTYEVEWNGQKSQVTVVRDNGDGTVEISIDGAEPMAASKEQVVEMVKPERAAAENGGGGAAAAAETGENGADGLNGPGAGASEGATETGEAPAAGAAQGAPLVDVEGAGGGNDDTVAGAPDAMPMQTVNGRQKPDWSKTTPARAHAYLYNERGLSRENADAFVENNLQAAASELEKQRGKQPKMGTDIDEYQEKKAAWEAEGERLRQEAAHWQAVKDEQRRKAESAGHGGEGPGVQQDGASPAVNSRSAERELVDNLREKERQEKIIPNLGNKYSLSSEEANNGELFYQNEDGSTTLTSIPDEIFERLGLPPVPFKLTETMGWHVYDHHAKEAKFGNIGDAIDFVLSIVNNVDHVRLGRDNSYIFSVEDGRNRIGKRAITIIINSDNGEFMGIRTSGYETLGKLKERPLLWERGAHAAPEDVATPTITTIESQQGDENSSRTKSQSNVSSAGKDTESSANIQENSEKVSENQSSNGGQAALAAAERETDTEPTEAQKEAGNYKKGHVKIDGYDVTIEQPKGSVRRGTDASGKQWEQEMHNTYGYIRGTEGVDGDHIDVFLSDDPSQGDVFVIDQVNEDGSFDEHKVMYGFPDIESARKAYLSNYEDGWQGLGAITQVSKDEFKKWIRSSHRKTKPFADYRSVKKEAGEGVAVAPQQTGPAVETPAADGASAEAPAGTSAETSAEAPQEDGGARMKFTERAEGARDVELARRERMARAMAAEMEGIFGVPMRVITRPEDITNDQARRKVEEDRQKGTEDTKAWYDTATGEVCVYAPHVGNPRVAMRTYLHEVVGHKGLRGLFRTETDEDGRETNPGFDSLCDRVWEMMPEAERKRFLNYPGVRSIADEQQRQRAAADEYMAHMAERDGEWDVDRSVKERVVHWLKMHLNGLLEKLGFDASLTDDDVRQLIKASARRLEREKRKAMKGAAERAAGGSIGESGARFSTTSILEGAGFEAQRPDDDGNLSPLVDEDGNFYVTLGGQRYDARNPITPELLKQQKNSTLGLMMRDAKAIAGLTDEQADAIYEKYAGILNQYLRVGTAANGGLGALQEQWLWLGETVYRTVATNGDAQYSFSMDITRVCKKNEAVIKTISALQRELGYGITPGQIMDIYLETEKQGYQVPCPVCYVFSRYIRNGKYASAAINGMTKYGEHLPGGSDEWTAEQWVAELQRLEGERATYDSAVKAANEDVTRLLGEIDETTGELKEVDGVPQYGEIDKVCRSLLTEKDAARRKELEERLRKLDARYRAALQVVSQQSLTNWIKSFAIHPVKGKWVKYEDTRKPANMDDFRNNALDLRLTANTMVYYPAIQRLRKSGGAAAGKEITFASDNRIGELLAGLGVSKPGESVNYYELAARATTKKERDKNLKKARERMRAAVLYAKRQSLRGGQRMWSWSDNIESLGPDVAVNLMQMQMLGGALQSYSKQLEGIYMVASMGGYVNGSLMAKDGGYRELTDADVREENGQKVLAHDITEEIDENTTEGKRKRTRVLAREGQYVYEQDGKLYTLIYDDIIGVDPFGHDGKLGLYDINKMLDKAGNILVGMNDIHVRAAMADPEIFFIIPWHASGQSQHLLTQMLSYLGSQLNGDQATDYTDMQEEKKVDDGGVTKEVVELWEDCRSDKFACGIEGGIESGDGVNLSAGQKRYRELRKHIFNGNIVRGHTIRPNRPSRTKDMTEEAYQQKLEEWREKLAECDRLDGGEIARMTEEVENDAFLSQVLRKVRETVVVQGTAKQTVNNGTMTNGDNKYIYPYEYWDESSTFDTADVNAERYLEYCRRMGVRPKFSGNWQKASDPRGNFIHDKGFWKLLIDRRMYDRNGNFQDLTPVDAAGFEPHMVDPKWTGSQFTVTQVADDAGVERIRDAVIKTESTRTDGGMPTVDYSLSMEDAVRNYRRARGAEETAEEETDGGIRLMSTEGDGGHTREEATERRRMEKQRRDEVNHAIDSALSFVTGKDMRTLRQERRAEEAGRKKLAKELYGKILANEFDDVTLQLLNKYIDDVTPRNPYGRRLSERLPQAVERAMYERARENALDALFSRISESAVRPHERTRASGRRAIEERKKELLELWAKATGNWHTDISDFTDSTESIGSGTDSDVYPSKDGAHVVKFSKGKPQGKRFRPDIDNIPLFNYLFPNSAYRILGYGNFGNGFVRILEQPAVDFEKSVPLTTRERVEFMEGIGFHPINDEKTAFSNGEIIVADLQKSNIVKDAAGNVTVIDADCKLHTRDVGGLWEYPPVESDMDGGAVTSNLSDIKDTDIPSNGQGNGGNNSQAGGELLREGYSEPAPAVERRRLTPKEQRQRDAYEARRFRNLHTFVDKTLDKLRIKDICDVYDSIDDVPGAQDMPSRRQHARGWYNPETGRITIVLRNHRSQEDVGLTILHEAVGHHGLRELFGERFDTFLDNVYGGAAPEIHSEINRMARERFERANSQLDSAERRQRMYDETELRRHVRAATEEYLAGLAERTDFRADSSPYYTWWDQIKRWFVEMLHDIGLPGFNGMGDITDNELRYVLWRSYKNLTEPGHYRNPWREAEDVSMQYRLKTGEFAEPAEVENGGGAVAEGGQVMFMSDEGSQEFHTVIDEMFDNVDFDRSAHARERYDLGATPDWMKTIGITGERFSLSFKNIKTHLGKDADHNLTAKEWHELPSALKHPFLVTSYGNKDGKFRLYTTIKVGDKFAVVGVDVVRINQGKGVPMLELNRIKTVFGRDRYVVENGERILAWDKNITPEQEALLRGHNYREYPTIQELSAANINNNYENPSISDENNSQEAVNDGGQALFMTDEVDDGRTEEIMERAKKKFGLTDDVREAGYVLPDGGMLDFSGRNELDAGADDSFLRGSRQEDHRRINSIAYDYDADGNEVRTGVETDMRDFIRRGGIRIDAGGNVGIINLAVKPTEKQRAALRRLINLKGGNVDVDFGDGWNSDHYVEYDGAKAQRVLGDIDRYFDEGIKPEGNVRFMSDGVDDTQRYYADLQKKYGGKPYLFIDVNKINKDNIEEFASLLRLDLNGLEKYSDEEIQEDIERLKDYLKGYDAYYLSNINKILIFNAKMSPERTEEVFFHENIHGVLHDLYGDKPRGIAERFWDIAPDNGKVKRKFIIDKYSEKDQKEELFVYWLSRSMRDGDVDNMLSLFEASEESVMDIERINNILKSFHYEQERETARRRSLGTNKKILRGEFRPRFPVSDGRGLGETPNGGTGQEGEQPGDLARFMSDEGGEAEDSEVRDEGEGGEAEGSELEGGMTAEEEAAEAVAMEPVEPAEMSLKEQVLQGLMAAAERYRQSGTMRTAAVKEISAYVSSLQNAWRKRKGLNKEALEQTIGAKVRRGMSWQKAEDQALVEQTVRLAKLMLQGNFAKGLTPGEVKRLMGYIQTAVGRPTDAGEGRRNAGTQDPVAAAKSIVDLLALNQLRTMKSMVGKMMQVKTSKVNSQGVEVQAGLDLKGQVVVKAMREALQLSEDDLGAMVGELRDAMGSEDPITAENAALRWQGYMLAVEYNNQVRDSESEEKQLFRELRAAEQVRYPNRKRPVRKDGSVGEVVSDEDAARYRAMTGEQYKEWVESMRDGIRRCRLERMESLQLFMQQLGGRISESVARAQEARDREVERVREIQHNANSDLQGMPALEQRKETLWDKFVNWAPVQFFNRSLANYDMLLRFLGERGSVDGRGYLWNRFMGGWEQARAKEQDGVLNAFATLDKKAQEVFGRKKVGGWTLHWSDIPLLLKKKGSPTVRVSFWNGDGMVESELSQGNIMYIYMVNKMEDGRMKLRRMGIGEEAMAQIEEQLDPRLKELADWLQGEYLPQLRVKYNEVHERLFGVPMAAIDDYFPLRINKNSLKKEEDVGAPRMGEQKPSTYTGAVIKRKRNTASLDLLGTDAMDVMLDHIQEMEHWAAFAELNRDMNTLLSYGKFRNRVKNMASLRFGSGEKLWSSLQDVFEIAAGVYRPKAGMLDKSIANVAKGVTSAKISLRVFTAEKQLFSYPAFLSNASAIELARAGTHWIDTWKWAMENLPDFRYRWGSRIAGDSRLLESDADWKMWKKTWIKRLQKAGMSANAAVDAFTVSQGAKAVYETAKKRYLKEGYSAERADELAKRDAVVCYNESQQSSENAFLSAMQLDRTASTVAFTVFRNGPMGYQRRFAMALARLKNKLTGKIRKEYAIEFMTKQLVRDGLDEDRARKAAESRWQRSTWKDLTDVAVFGYICQLAWNASAYLNYIIFGDDGDDKWEMVRDCAWHAIGGGVEGLTGGNLISDNTYAAIKSWFTGDKANMDWTTLPLRSDIEKLSKRFDSDKIVFLNDLINLAFQVGVGTNPQTVADIVYGVWDACNGDFETAQAFKYAMLRIICAPQSQVDKLWIDELGLTKEEAGRMSLDQLARHYANYKMNHNAPWTSWAYGDARKAEIIEKHTKELMKMVDESLEGADDETLKRLLDGGDGDLAAHAAKRVYEDAGLKKGSTKTDYGKRYDALATYEDVLEDVLLKQALQEAGEDSERGKAIKRLQNRIRAIKRGKDTEEEYIPGLANPDGDEEEIMRQIRGVRAQGLRELGIR